MNKRDRPYARKPIRFIVEEREQLILEERERICGEWHTNRIGITREELAKLAQEFPVLDKKVV